MKISLNWIKDYVDLPAEVTPDRLLYDLTMTTVEVEGYIDQSQSLEGVLVGEVKELKAHPKADRLQIAMTDIGGEVKQIVCGGSNLRVGMFVAVGAPGAMVRWHGEGDLIELKETKIRGEKSYGMICAADEIGLGELFPSEDEKEIIDLPGDNHKAGTPLAEALGLNDTIFEIDNKSLTNRPDLWGHYGIARELAAIYSQPLKPLPSFSFPKSDGDIKIQIEDTELCSRFVAVSADNVRVEESPFWMRSRLASVGQRPIDLIVDLTNYVMFAIGRPTHAFDRNQVENQTLIVRGAKEGEKLTLLDSTELELEKDTLLVSDPKRALSLAGIIGGKDSGISKETTQLLFEAANWNPVMIRKRATQYGVRTESSIRFEKGLDPYLPLAAAELFFSLLTEIQPDVKLLGINDQFPKEPNPVSVSVTKEFIDSRIGVTLDIPKNLERFGFTVEESKTGEYTVGVPHWRATGDITLPEDIVEEVARLHGYDNIDFVAPEIKLERSIHQPTQDLERSLKEYLSLSAGMFEVYSYPWVEESAVEACKMEIESRLSLSDPPAPTISTLATDLVPNLVAIAKRNAHELKEFSLYEVGITFSADERITSKNSDESLPGQKKSLAALIYGEESKQIFLELKGIITDMFTQVGLGPLTFEATESGAPYLAKEAALEVKLAGKRCGELGILSPSSMQKAAIHHGRIAVLTLDLDSITAPTVKETTFQPLAKYPMVEYDLAPLFRTETLWEEIYQTVKDTDPLIKEVHFSDEYIGKQIPEGKKSLAFKMIIGSEDGTLTSEEVQVVADKVLKKIEADFGAALRD